MADSDSDESFSGFSDIGSDIDVNLAGNFDGEISSVSSVSSDDIVREPETAWTDAPGLKLKQVPTSRGK